MCFLVIFQTAKSTFLRPPKFQPAVSAAGNCTNAERKAVDIPKGSKGAGMEPRQPHPLPPTHRTRAHRLRLRVWLEPELPGSAYKPVSCVGDLLFEGQGGVGDRR